MQTAWCRERIWTLFIWFGKALNPWIQARRIACLHTHTRLQRQLRSLGADGSILRRPVQRSTWSSSDGVSYACWSASRRISTTWRVPLACRHRSRRPTRMPAHAIAAAWPNRYRGHADGACATNGQPCVPTWGCHPRRGSVTEAAVKCKVRRGVRRVLEPVTKREGSGSLTSRSPRDRALAYAVPAQLDVRVAQRAAHVARWLVG